MKSLPRNLVVLCLLTSAVACDPQVPDDLVSVRRLPSGEVEVLYRRCPGEVVTTVEVLEPVGNVIADDDDVEYWRIDSREGVQISRVVVGNVPDGFSETLALRGALPPNSELAVVVDTDLRPQPHVIFRLSELRESEVLSGPGYSEPESFLSSDPADCPKG